MNLCFGKDLKIPYSVLLMTLEKTFYILFSERVIAHRLEKRTLSSSCVTCG